MKRVNVSKCLIVKLQMTEVRGADTVVLFPLVRLFVQDQTDAVKS